MMSKPPFLPAGAVLLCLTGLTTVLPAGAALADDPQAAEAAAAMDDRRATAVALNYCRAAFHHIRKSPHRATLYMERQKILNNLNLDAVADPEVIRLYTAVLDEIGSIQIAERERSLLKQQYRRNLTQKLTWDLLAFGTQLATAQVGNAIKTGANSWWDYRNMTIGRDRDMLKIDRSEMSQVVQKSSMFLDTFWKLAQKKDIPDRWLVRGEDLDRLDLAMREPDPEVRLRILKRMDPFMEAYPPYWYYVARTEQQLGRLTAASETYAHLAMLGDGHFRRDDMLASGLANRAAILDHLEDPTAVATAQQALKYSPDVWEANLLCARVLERHQRLAAAEDAILRNIDVGLEHRVSQVFRVSLYYHSGQTRKLADVLTDERVVAELPMSALIRCTALLGAEKTPGHVLQRVAQSIEARPQVNFGPDGFVLNALPVWQLHLARATLLFDGQPVSNVERNLAAQTQQLRFSTSRDWGNPLLRNQPGEVAVVLTYPDETSIRLSFGNATYAGESTSPVALGTATPTLRLGAVEVGETRLAIHSAAYSPRWEAVPLAEPPPEGSEL